MPTTRTRAARPLAFRLLRRAGSWPVGGRFGAALALGLAGYALAPVELPPAGRAVVAWDAFALTSLALIWCLLLTADAGHTRTVAARESPGRVVAFGLVPVAVACSLSAVGLLLSTGMMPTLPPAVRLTHVGLAGAGVAAAWGLLHTVFALRYAHLYYNAGPAPGGLEFPPGSPRPDYLDFAYFAFGLGMTAQTSDVSIYGRPLRHAALLHGVLSFAFNTAVVAVSISGLAGVL
ncbi:Uncharacterized membrane protein [Hymenobacter daecheongensis DSM 21074]|uniref:Uncharacterized membrane protein n=1 Tax=Hymenobacter daecheongensis DSM 21074 TaxID=1121955 RepID=A0A1M6KTF8_9BACT|nr:DUF1345 domain-containing protein [Hymenobacter daecheongensis]SHJ62203.1 Uncharacterized membrane protein [Hymenobacter daecheongensis DSM 21074]